MNDRLLCILLIFLNASLYAQVERQQLYGKLTSDEISVNSIFIINKTTGEETKSNNKGNFSLYTGAGDILVIYSPEILSMEIKINAENFNKMPFIIALTAQARELSEVVLEKQVNAVSLGIVPKDQKKYTHAERRLYTAGDFKPIHLLGLLGGGLALDPIINAINGKTKRLKKEVALEKKEFLIDEIYGIYTEIEIINLYNIPEEYVKGFMFYLAEDAEFTEAVNTDETERAKFRIAILAKQYMALIETKE